jgi:hypothetical protein
VVFNIPTALLARLRLRPTRLVIMDDDHSELTG